MPSLVITDDPRIITFRGKGLIGSDPDAANIVEFNANVVLETQVVSPVLSIPDNRFLVQVAPPYQIKQIGLVGPRGPVGLDWRVDLGDTNIHPNNFTSLNAVQFIQFDIEFFDGHAEGRLQWNAEDGTPEIGMPGGNVNLQIGQETLVRVRNATGETIANGSPVYIIGVQANRPLVALAQANSIPEAFVAGLMTEDIADNSNGYMTIVGLVRGLNTEGLIAGALVYLSETVAGGYQQNRPVSGSGNAVILGVVIREHATEGVILHQVTIVPRFDRASGVKLGVPIDGQIFAYNAANKHYELITPTVPISFESYDAKPARSSEDNIHGGLSPLVTTQPLNAVPTDIVVTKGTGKILIVVHAGSDFDGSITITGTSVDRNTGDTTESDVETLSIDALTIDTSDTDSNGNTRHDFVGAYISSKWFTGTVVLSTTDLSLTDVDVYHISFEQFNDSSSVVINTLDINLITTNVSAEFDSYLYCLETTTGNKATLTRCAELHIGADGETAIANKYWRLRKGLINKAIDGTTDGVWVDTHYSSTPAYIEDVTLKVWATKRLKD